MEHECVLTGYREVDGPYQGRVRTDLALVDAGVALGGRAEPQPPVIIRQQQVEGESRVARVRLLAEREQVELVAAPSHPRDLQRANFPALLLAK